MDSDLELALKLSRLSYEREQSQAEANQDLIAFEDISESIRRQQIEEIQRLYNESPQSRPNFFTPYAHSHFPNVGGSEWRSISFPNRLNNATTIPTPSRELSWQHDGLGSSVPSSTLTQICDQPRPSFLWKQDSFQGSDVIRNQASPLNSAPLIVPFRPMSTRLINGDLIDLGEPDGLDFSAEGIHQFDPLWKPPELITVNDVQHLERPESSEAGWSVPPEIPSRTTSLVRENGKKTRKPIPEKAPPTCYSAADLSIHAVEPLSDQQLCLLRSSHSYPTVQSNFLFYAAVVDYFTTTASSVKITVFKDYSWPRSVNSSDDYVSFTCSTSSLISEILDNVLMTFLSAEELTANSGQLPSDQYGLKIYGLDEFLPKTSKVGQCPHLGKAITFGKDYRIEIGKLQTLTSSVNNTRNTPRKHFNRACVLESELNVVLEVIKREMRRAEENFNTDLFSASIHAVMQSLKSLCVLMHRVQPCDLVAAVQKYCKAETKAEFIRYTAETYAAIHRLIRLYTKSSNAKFRLDAEKSPTAEEARSICDVVSVQEELLLCVESVHNLPEEWVSAYDCFYMTVHLIHGTAEVCRGWREHPRPLSTKTFFPAVKLNLWVTFELPICVMPREARFVLVLYGVEKADPSNPDANVLQTTTTTSMGANMQPARSSGPIDRTRTVAQLACASVPLFDSNAMFSQGPFMVPLKRGNAVHPWGARPLVSSPADPVAIVTLPEFKYDIRFPPVSNVDHGTTRDFAQLDCTTQECLLDILETASTNNLTSDEKEMLWERRHYLTHLPHALPLVLASAVGWDWASLNNTYRMTSDWTDLNPVQAIELLLPHFPDIMVRRRAVEWLRSSSSEFLFNFLPQLIEALRFEPWECSALAVFLLDVSVKDNRFAFEVYWQLQMRIENSTDRSYSARCQMLQEELLHTIGTNFSSEVNRQHALLAKLDEISQAMRVCPEGRMLQVLQQHLSTLDSDLLIENVRLPLVPSYLCTGIAVGECNYFNSLTKPIKIAFKGLKMHYQTIYKIGDDMRQDAIVLQMVRMMNQIWLNDLLDLRMVIFRCLPTGIKKGLIELVDDCQTLREIQSAQGATGVFKDDVLNNWLLMQNPSEFQYKIALENFQRSCAGWCVATYLLGIGDRHNDNILVTTTGHVFHIDFGKYMGDWQMAAGFKRDRVPFIFTSDMAYVINGGSQQNTEQYQIFVDNCCKAFNLLRKKHSLLLNLMKLMVCSGIPGMDSAAVAFVQNNLMLNLTETEATVQFSRMIQESVQSRFPRLNFFAHTIVQLKNSSSIITKLSGGRDNPNLLSFAPRLYTEKDDGRIDSVKVVGFEKWMMPNKTYIYRIEVRRKNVNVFSTVYRTFAEFHELYVKLYRRFPISILPPLSRGTTMGRSNIREVAQRRQFDIQLFLRRLFELSDEIAHCDFIYTFFHSIYRDCDPSSVNKAGNPSQVDDGNDRSNVNSAGNIFLRLTYAELRGTLSIFVGHGKHLPLVGNGQPPDSYVKTYLRPDLQRSSKRKTQVVKNTQNPTFNEEITYNLLGDYPLNSTLLKVAVWHYGSSIVKDNCMLGCVYIPLTKLDDVKVDRKGVKTLENWFELSRYE
ncbi:hypothetical protein QR680_001978 [Steinernema hermaphroditum]|uniref:phosphatidylinositol 3-kinase n=1 Tax=Steinernema hermaphroditum TaxID=289476 RepID=A0AA39H2T1_9BILA|nr:hypothetical protein QR680_001978 [Steinernema hermaphroditum]